MSLPSLLGSLVAWQRTPSTEEVLGSIGGEASQVWPARGFALQPIGGRPKAPSSSAAKTLALGAPFQIEDAVLLARVDQEGLSVTDLKGRLFGGSFAVSGTLSPRGAGAQLKAHAQLTAGKLDQLSQSLVGRVLAKGPFTLTFNVTGEGLSPPGLVAGLNGEGTLFLDPGVLQALSPDPLRRVAIDAARSKKVKLDKDQIAAQMHAMRDKLTHGTYAYAATELPFEVKNGTLKLKPAVLAGKGAETTINGYIELASLRVDSEWAMRLSGGGNADVPPVSLVFAGPLSDAGAITPTIDTAPVESFLTMRRMQEDVERLETLDVSGRNHPPADADPSPDTGGAAPSSEEKRAADKAADKLAAEQAAADKAALDKLAAEKAAVDKAAANKAAAEKLAAEKAAAEKLAEKAAADRAAAEKVAAEKVAADKAAAEKLAAEKAAAQKLAEKAAADKAAAEKLAADKAAADKAAAEKLAAEKAAAEKLAEKAAADRAAAEKVAAEKVAADKAAAEKLAAEKAAADKAAAQKLAADKAAADKAAAEKLAAEKAAAEKLAEKAAADRAAAEKAAAEKAAADKAAAEKLAAEKAAAQKLAEKAAADKAAAQKLAEKAAADRAAAQKLAEKAAADKVVTEKLDAEKAAADKAAAEKLAAEKAAADKAAAQKLAEKAAADKAAAEKRAADANAKEASAPPPVPAAAVPRAADLEANSGAQSGSPPAGQVPEQLPWAQDRASSAARSDRTGGKHAG